jgi:hypothetical protein
MKGKNNEKYHRKCLGPKGQLLMKTPDVKGASECFLPVFIKLRKRKCPFVSLDHRIFFFPISATTSGSIRAQAGGHAA